MMAAERWYEYQENYKRYGLDMKPREVKVVKPKSKSILTAKDKGRLLGLTVFVGVLCIGVIIATAYAASVKYQINAVIKENSVITGEIENLEVQVKSAANIRTVEQKAVAELGMVAPMPYQVVYIAVEEEPAGDFAVLLKEQAYN